MKKIIAALLAASVTVLLCAPALAFVPQKIKSLRGDFVSRLSDISLDGSAIEFSGLAQISARPASELEIALVGKDNTANLFLDRNGVPINTADVTVSRMRAANVTVKMDVTSGEDILTDAELTVRNPGTSAARPVIRLRFPDEYASLDPVGFSASLCVLIGGWEQADTRLELSGTFGNPEIEIALGDVTVSANSAVLLAREDIPLIAIDAGSSILVEASMRAYDRCFVSASPSSDEYDLLLLEENNGLTDVLKLKIIGLEPWQIKSVSVESDTLLQVYDENGNRLGDTSRKLPYAEKYYLASRALSF